MATKKDKIRKIEIEARHIEPDDKWHTKEEVAELEQASLKWWTESDDEQRQAVIVLARDALMRLIDDPDMWIPVSLEPKSGNRVDLFISIHFAEIDGEVVRRRVETEREIVHAREDLVKLHTELDPAVQPAEETT